MKRYNEYCGRYTSFHLPDIEECSYERLLDSSVCKKGVFFLEEDIWSELENLFRLKINNTLDEDVINLLTEIVQWVESRDIYAAMLLISLCWEEMELIFEEKESLDRIADFVAELRFSIE